MVCMGCEKTPLQLEEYRLLAMEDEDDEPTEEEILKTAWAEEGTLNTENGHFLCNACYIAAGMPSSPSGWRCP